MESILNLPEIISTIVEFYDSICEYYPPASYKPLYKSNGKLLLVSKKWCEVCLPFYKEFIKKRKFNFPFLSKTFYPQKELRHIKHLENGFYDYAFYVSHQNKIFCRLSHTFKTDIDCDPYWLVSFYIDQDLADFFPDYFNNFFQKNNILDSLINKIHPLPLPFTYLKYFSEPKIDSYIVKILAKFSFQQHFSFSPEKKFLHVFWDHEDDILKTEKTGVLHYTPLESILEEILIFKKIYDKMYYDFLIQRK